MDVYTDTWLDTYDNQVVEDRYSDIWRDTYTAGFTSAVSKTLSISYDVRAVGSNTIGKTVSLLWNQRAVANQDLAIIWSVIASTVQFVITGPPSRIDAEAAILAATTEITRRVAIYEQDGSTLWLDDAILIDGTISVDFERDERRSVDLVLSNPTGTLDHKPGAFWYDKVIKVYRGVNTSKGLFEVQVGEFVIDNIAPNRIPKQVKITGRDYTKRCLNSKLSAATTFQRGTQLEAIIKAFAYGSSCTKLVIANTGIVLGVNTTFDRGATRWECMKQLCDAYAYNLFFNPQGYLIMRPFLDPVLSPINYTFETGKYGNLMDFNKSTADSEIFNHVIVTGENSSNDIVPWGEALNVSGTPTSIAELGNRVNIISSPFIQTNAAAAALAAKYLKISALEQYNIDMEALVIPWLDAGQIIEFVDPDADAGQPSKYLLSSLNIPLGLNPMSVTAKRIIKVG